jgi:ABC-type branched-subunit amino acid transport system permease subunit
VRNIVHLNYVIAAALGGIGGGLTALAVGHIDPDMAYWTTSGEFVFVAVLSGTGNVLAPFFGSVMFEAIRTLANQYAPNIWQMTLGLAMLAIIMFLPDGLWALFRRKARAA